MLQTILEKTRAPRRRAVLARLLQLVPGEAIELARIAGEAGASPATVRKLVKLGLITVTPTPDFQMLGNIQPGEASGPPATIPELNSDQRSVFDQLSPHCRQGGFSVNLLYGVTGSGKTEVYLRCIKEVIE